MKFSILIKIPLKFIFKGSINNKIFISSDNGLVPKKWSITWTNVDQQICLYMNSLGHNGLKCKQKLYLRMAPMLSRPQGVEL